MTAPLYVGLIRDDLRIHLSEHHGDCTPGAALRIEVDDIDALHADLGSRNYRFLNPGIETQPWAREISVKDPFGNRVVFFQNLPAAD